MQKKNLLSTRSVLEIFANPLNTHPLHSGSRFDIYTCRRYNPQIMREHRLTSRFIKSPILIALMLTVLTTGCIVRSGEPLDAELYGTVEALEGIVSNQATQISSQATMISYLATRGPSGLIATTESPPTPYYPVRGSVVIEQDRCCAGGIAGQTIELNTQFEASSPFGEVTHMRVHTGSGPQRVDQLPATSTWEPFASSKTFTTQVALNWVGFFVSAQFRDSAGNLSAVIFDDISIEGMPPPTP
jgi:hypothetical protein